MSEPATQDPHHPAPRSHAARVRAFTILGAVLVIVALGFLLYWALIGRNYVSTDNAYVDADTAEITPMVAGQVAQVLVGDTQAVRAGQVLVKIDDTDAKVALDRAQAQLAQAQRKVGGYFANDKSLAGQVDARQAQIASADAQIATADANLDQALTELGRRQRLAASGAVSGDELTQAQDQFRTAQAALTQARAAKAQALADKTAAVGARNINTALISGVSLNQNPEVAAAQAAVDQAQLDYDRTVLRAPFDGVVAKKTVALGQRVQVGEDLMSVVPVSRVYVNANFKENQLRHVSIGQPVVLTSDLYGGSVKFHGRVVGLSGGTGAAFALIPAQNATGNWIKVVQRLPVRVQLDPNELKAHPLRVGLSMNATIHLAGD
jgi:membrane fusion protein (multidrug efflux system)